jgi:hypothetical protein
LNSAYHLNRNHSQEYNKKIYQVQEDFFEQRIVGSDPSFYCSALSLPCRFGQGMEWYVIPIVCDDYRRTVLEFSDQVYDQLVSVTIPLLTGSPGISYNTDEQTGMF